MKLADKLKELWYVSVLLVCAVVAGATWKVCVELLVKPRDFRIENLEKQSQIAKQEAEKELSKLRSDKAQLEKQLTDSTRKIKGVSVPQKPRPDEVVVDFPWVDTPSAPGHIVAAAPYLHGVGISVVDLKPNTSEVVLINNRALYQGQAVRPTTSQNFLTQIGTGDAQASFTLVFSEPLKSVSFTRPALYPATTSGITHPAWSAFALDAGDRELSSHHEDLTRSLSDVPAQRYTLKAPGFDGIFAVRFESDLRLNGKPFAAFGAILIEKLTVVRQRKTPAPQLSERARLD